MAEIAENRTETRTVEERLEHLLQSETVRLVDSGKFTPGELDNTLRNMRKQIENLQYEHFLNLSEIVRLRRLTEFLIGHDNPEV